MRRDQRASKATSTAPHHRHAAPRPCLAEKESRIRARGGGRGLPPPCPPAAGEGGIPAETEVVPCSVRLTDTRVDHAVHDVDQQLTSITTTPSISMPLAAPVVAPVDGLDQPLADTGPGEDRLGEEAPVNSTPTCSPITVTTGSARCAARAHDDAQRRQALGARCGCSLRQDFEHGERVIRATTASGLVPSTMVAR